MPNHGARGMIEEPPKKLVCTYCTQYDEFQTEMPWVFLSVHGWQYTGPLFVYCPFCGHKLELVEMELWRSC